MRKQKKHPLHSNRETRLVEFCPVTLSYDNNSISGHLVDLSRHGAKISVKQGDLSGFEAQTKATLSVKTPYGSSKCNCIIEWVEESEYDKKIGLLFPELPKNPKDPLRCLVDSFV